MSILSTGIYDSKYHQSNLFLFTQTVDFRVPLRIICARSKRMHMRCPSDEDVFFRHCVRQSKA